MTKEIERVTCPTCNGYGYVIIVADLRNANCSRCGGTGRITVEKK